MALGSTQPLTEMSTDFQGLKAVECVRLTTLSPSCAIVMQSGNFNFLEPSGPLQACNGTDLPLPLILLFFLAPSLRFFYSCVFLRLFLPLFIRLHPPVLIFLECLLCFSL